MPEWLEASAVFLSESLSTLDRKPLVRRLVIEERESKFGGILGMSQSASGRAVGAIALIFINRDGATGTTERGRSSSG
jgi:hypothetical protein